MNLDPQTVRVVATLTLIGPTALFAAATAQRHNEPASRMWSVGFLATTVALGAASVLGDTAPDHVLTFFLAALPVLGLSALWMGTRLINRRRAGWAVTAAALLVVGIATAADPEVARGVQLLVMAALGVLTVLELGSGSTRDYVEARFLRIVLSFLVLVSLAAVVRQSVGSVPEAAPSDWRVLGVAAMFSVTIAVALNAMREGQAERRLGARVGRATVAGLLNPADFRSRAVDQLSRAGLTGQSTELLVVAVHDLDALVHAYGEQARQTVIVHVAEVLRHELSADRLLGYIGRGRFAVLLVDPGP
ncbi:MAG: GGDEF domain-containing protein, partial [Actinomycetales bacterium]